MGRGGKYKQWGKETQHGAGAQQLWRGSWSPGLRADPSARPWRENSNKEAAPAPSFPAYDSMPSAAPGNLEVVAQQGRSHGLQGLLNAARKAELRLQKLLRAKDRAAEQWETFQRGLKDSFIKEQTRFNKNGARLDREIAEATVEQDKAYEDIQQSVLRGGEPPDAPMAAAEAEASWDRMRNGWENEDADAMSHVLRRAVEAPRTAASNAMRQLTPAMQELLVSFGAIPAWAASARAGGDLRAPLAPQVPAAPKTSHPDGSGLPSTSAAPSETRQATPHQGKADMQISPAHPGQRDMAAARVPTAVEAPRPGIKAATMAPTAAGTPHSLLADKLDAKRANAKPHAMQPFRGGGAPLPGNVDGSAVPVEDPSDQEMNEADVKDGPQSPGSPMQPGHPEGYTADVFSVSAFACPDCEYWVRTAFSGSDIGLLSPRLHCPLLDFAGAHNTCIGCSGTRALPVSLAYPFSYWRESLAIVGVVASVPRCLYWNFGRDSVHWLDVTGASLSIVVPDFTAAPPQWQRLLGGLLGVHSTGYCVLAMDWHFVLAASGVVAFFMGFASLPVRCCVDGPLHLAIPVILSIPSANCVSTPVVALTPTRQPHEIPVEELADVVGETLERPRQAFSLGAIDSDQRWVVAAQGPLPDGRDIAPGHWLGVIVMTPHFRDVCVAVRCRHFHTYQHVVDIVLDSVPGGPRDVGLTCVPTRPQFCEGYATFVRFPTSVHHHPQGRRVAVLVDLTSVGGNRFACALPQHFTMSELLAFVTPLASASDSPLRLYVAEETSPCTRESLLLQDGYVLAFFEQRPPLHRCVLSVAELMSEPSRWCPPEQLLHVVDCEGVLVHHGRDRFYMPAHHHAGQTAVEAVRTAYDYADAESVSCAFSMPDLDFRGNAVSHILFVAEVLPTPATASPAERRRDHFALCDFRPVGYSPRVVHTSVPLLHLPSLAAAFGIRVPVGMRLYTFDGKCEEDEVRFEGNPVLSFVFEDCPEVEPVAVSSGLFVDLAALITTGMRAVMPYPGIGLVLWPDLTWVHANDPVWATKEAYKWSPGFLQDALPESTWELTSVPALFVDVLGKPWSASLLSATTSLVPWKVRVGFGLTWAAMDEDTLGSEDASEFTFCLLTPGYTLEPVVVNLSAPVEIPDALQVVREDREPVRGRLYPALVVVDPQPAQGFGVLLALPAWPSPEVFICFSLLDIDDRLFVASAPLVASRERLLELAELEPAELYDVYVGGSPTPMVEAEEVDLVRGMCIFCYPRHVLPGPYFHLTESLLSSAAWESNPSLPFGPADGFMCFVGEFAQRRVPLEEDASFPDNAEIAAALGLHPERLVVQPAYPVTQDVALNGFYCYNVCAALDLPEPDAEDGPPCIVLIDCRALLQGWQMVSCPAAVISRTQLIEDLSTFAPPGWSVHLEGIPAASGNYEVSPGKVLYASYVMDTHPWHETATAEVASEEAEEEGSSGSSEPSFSPASSPVPYAEERSRSRSPYRDFGQGHTSSDTRAEGVPFLLLGQEYAPEMVIVSQDSTELSAVLRSVQSRRDATCRRRFAQLVPVHPQPAESYALAIVKPVWSREVYVVFDCLRVNGSVFCWLASAAMTRSAILAVAGIPDTSEHEVYVPDQDLPLGAQDVCRLNTGACVSIVPVSCPWFVVASLQDMLLDSTSWSTAAALPCVPGDWLYVLSDTGPCCLQIPEARPDELFSTVADALGVPLSRATFQLAFPPVDDFSDEGRIAWNIAVLTSTPSAPIGREGCVYFLDLRALMCGLTWAFTPECARPTAGGHLVEVLGGRPVDTDSPDEIHVWPGEVLVVQVLDAGAAPSPAFALPSEAPGPGDAHDDNEDGASGNSAPSRGISVRAGSAGSSAHAGEGPSQPGDCFDALSSAMSPASADGRDGGAVCILYALGGIHAIPPRLWSIVACRCEFWSATSEWSSSLAGHCHAMSRKDPESAFFNAATLLETLSEHFSSDVGSPFVGCNGRPANGDAGIPHFFFDEALEEPPCELVLSSLLDFGSDADVSVQASNAEWYSLDCGSCLMPISDPHWQDLHRFVSIDRLLFGIEGLPRPQRFAQWVAMHEPKAFLSDATEICLTSDGSFSDRHGAAGWGVVLSVLSPAFPVVPGSYVGYIAGNSIDLWAFGDQSQTINAFGSEIVGLFWAAVAAFQLPFSGRVIFRCDNQAALGIAAGHAALYSCIPGEDMGVQSGMYGHVGRVALLDASLKAEGVFVAGLQETRTPEGQLASKNYHRYCAGCLDKKVYGIEIWVGTFAGHPTAFRLAWWKATADLCMAFSSALDWVFLVDANCSLGSTVSRSVGAHLAEEEDEAGEAFHSLLHSCGTWVPSTFSDSFSGDGGTLVQKRSSTLARRDFVALPLAWRDCVSRGYVSPAVNAGHSVPDRFAIVIHVELDVGGRPATRPSPRIDGEALLLPQNSAAVEAVLSALPVVPWDTNVNDHISVLTDALYRGLANRFPRQRRRMRQGFLSEETSRPPVSMRNLPGAGMRSDGAWPKCDAVFCDVPLLDRAAHLNKLAAEVDDADASSVHIALRGEEMCLERFVKEGLMESRAPALQVGGRPGRTYMFGSFVSRCFLCFARLHSVSAAIVFTDLVAAYYSVVREAVTGLAPDASVQDVAASLRLTDGDLQELEAHAREHPVLSGPDSPAFLRALTEELHSDTWFHLNGDPSLVRAARGTRPGGCLADTVFSLLFQKVLARRVPASDCQVPRVRWSGVRELRLFQESQASHPSTVRVEDITYADDHASCVVAPSALQLEQAVRNTAGRTLDSVAGHGLAANLGPRKTAALMLHRGAGSKAARARTFGQLKGKLLVLREHSKPVTLDAVPQYRHLGTLLTHTGSLLPEVRSRLALARVTLGEGRRKVFCCAQVLLERRVTLFQAHVMSAFLAGSGAWPQLGHEAWHTFEHGITAMYRQLLRIRPCDNQRWSRDAIFNACNAPTPEDSLAAERLRFLGQLARGGPDEAWALLQHSPDVIAGFTGALQWLSDAVYATCELPAFDAHCSAWLDFARDRAKRWKGLIKRGLQWHRGSRRSRVAFVSFCREIWTPLAQAGDLLDAQTHACLVCSRAFSCSQSWASHAALKHGYRNKAMRLARGCRCQACGTVFACARRMRQHLGLSPRCLQSVERADASLLPVLELADGHVQSRAQHGRGLSHLPVAEEDVCWELLRELRSRQLCEDTEIMELVKAYVEPFPTLRNSLQRWASELRPSPQLDAVSDLLLCFTPFWLCEEAVARRGSCEDNVFRPDVRPLPWCPRPAGLAGLLMDFPESQALVHRCASWRRLASLSFRSPTAFLAGLCLRCRSFPFFSATMPLLLEN
ncbi:unnamed protein product [Symbiodinium necroappetens]|uniref:C2H2-type domain-containing protein n=1 Tax=Symbiodinium necroappetens TaxID=1628268 RepID=A0A812U5U5_9DINO|nr:unnamed protein product [Symbiodinium necroappetens]